MNLRQFLEIYKNKNHTDMSDVMQYYKQFLAISQNLIVAEKHDIFTQS